MSGKTLSSPFLSSIRQPNFWQSSFTNYIVVFSKALAYDSLVSSVEIALALVASLAKNQQRNKDCSKLKTYPLAHALLQMIANLLPYVAPDSNRKLPGCSTLMRFPKKSKYTQETPHPHQPMIAVLLYLKSAASSAVMVSLIFSMRTDCELFATYRESFLQSSTFFATISLVFTSIRPIGFEKTLLQNSGVRSTLILFFLAKFWFWLVVA